MRVSPVSSNPVSFALRQVVSVFTSPSWRLRVLGVVPGVLAAFCHAPVPIRGAQTTALRQRDDPDQGRPPTGPPSGVGPCRRQVTEEWLETG